MTHHDLLIIGTGSGNMLLTSDFDDADVAIVERDVFGGTCLNRGCIPSKMMIYPAELAELAQYDGPRLGVDTSFGGARWPEIRDRIFGRIDPIADGGRNYRVEEQDHVTVYEGSAKFVGDRTVEIAMNDGSTTIASARNVVIATGASPVVPELVRSSGVPFHTSDTIMRIDELPERLIVLGGGYIGAELGNAFGMLGSRVTIVNRSMTLLRHEDPEISRRFTEAYDRKFELCLGATLTGLRQTSTGIELDLEIGADSLESTIEGDALLVALGRRPTGHELAVNATGAHLDADGYVVTDHCMRTGAAGVWALGDVTNPAQLKHTANAEARVVAHNIAHPNDLVEIDRHAIPHAVFGHPQVASVGLTEPEVFTAGIDYVVATQPYGSAAYGWAMEDEHSVCKVIADAETRLLLGAHIIGPQASTLIQQLIQGMRFGQTVDEMATGQLYIHPALTEVVEQALLAL